MKSTKWLKLVNYRIDIEDKDFVWSVVYSPMRRLSLHSVFHGNDFSIRLTWEKGEMNPAVHRVVSFITGLARPGVSAGHVVWTSDWNLDLTSYKDFKGVSEEETYKLVKDLHLLLFVDYFPDTSLSDVDNLLSNPIPILEDVFSNQTVLRYSCLEEQGFYQKYEKEILSWISAYKKSIES